MFNKFFDNLLECLIITGILFTFMFASSILFIYNEVYFSLAFTFLNAVQIYLYQLWREYR